ncbi:MAG: sugar ABC transporter permease, partial [Rhodospirillaceae bacterium]|nr:sugar ABC transporter permease [Rhodospirillaceae bacterium]
MSEQTTSVENPPKRGASLKAAEARTRLISYLFCLPAISLMIIILLVPIFIAGVLSFTDYSLGNTDFNWQGTKNYERIFGRSSYQKMLWASATYVLVVVPASIGLGLGAALLI